MQWSNPHHMECTDLSLEKAEMSLADMLHRCWSVGDTNLFHRPLNKKLLNSVCMCTLSFSLSLPLRKDREWKWTREKPSSYLIPHAINKIKGAQNCCMGMVKFLVLLVTDLSKPQTSNIYLHYWKLVWYCKIFQCINLSSLSSSETHALIKQMLLQESAIIGCIDRYKHDASCHFTSH